MSISLKVPPLFKGEDRIANSEAAPYLFGYPDYDEPETSPYYWWFQYLRRHEGYRRCCERNGTGKLASLYKDWGDVREDDFAEWFEEHGTIFREPEVEDVLAEITDTSQLKNLDWDAAMVVVLPTRIGPRSLSKRDMKRQFSDLLDRKFPAGEVGRRTYLSAAKYRIEGYPKLQALKERLAIWDLRHSEPSLQLWEIGERLHKEKKLSSALHQVTKRTDTSEVKFDKKRGMARAVKRHLKFAKEFIDGSVCDTFPKRFHSDI